jgi:hypothetical protein
MKFMIAVPAYGGSIKNGCVESLLKLQSSLLSRGVSADYGILNIAGIPETRNYYASILLQRAEHSHVLFVDSDMAFEPASFWKLVNAGFVVYNHGPIRAKNGLAQVEGIGMGLCLIQTACFRSLLNTGQIAKYHGHPFASHGLTGPLFGFFDPTPIDGEYTTEDYAFCRRWRTLCGGEVWALPSEDVGHIGEYVYRGKPDIIG